MRWFLLIFLVGCGSSGASTPFCAEFTPEHVTQEDYVQLGDLAVGEVVEDALTWYVAHGSTVGDAILYADAQPDCGSNDCELEWDCGPDEVADGSNYGCDLTVVGPEGCSFDCEVQTRANIADDSTCREVTDLARINGGAPPMLGR